MLAEEAPGLELEATVSSAQACTEAGATSPEDLLEIEDPIPSTGCNAELTCYDGSEISCSGSSSCNVYTCSVRCDGVTTWCCDLSGLECPERACAYCYCLAEGFLTPQQCSDEACRLFPAP